MPERSALDELLPQCVRGNCGRCSPDNTPSFVLAWACSVSRAIPCDPFFLSRDSPPIRPPILYILATVAQAGSDPPSPLSYFNHAGAASTGTATPLTMEEAARLAAVDQPLQTGRQAKIQAEEQRAIAAAQLPDPQLSGGLKELPIDTPEAFSTRRDNFTEFTIGLNQEFPRAEKRRLQGVLESNSTPKRTVQPWITNSAPISMRPLSHNPKVISSSPTHKHPGSERN